MASPTVRIHAVDLDRPEAEVERLGAFLTPDERDAPPRVRVSRAAARIVLGEALAMDPAAVPISRRCEHCGHPSHGRPVIAGVPLSFNVSHSGPLALVAVLERDARVGVDVEVVRSRGRLDALARRIFDSDEYAAWLDRDDPDARLRAFFEMWTVKEAVLKARGVGITTALREVPHHPDGWTVARFSPRDGFVAALAADQAVGVDVREHALGVTPNGGTAR